MAWEGVGSLGQLRERVDSGISTGKGFSRGGGSDRARRAGIGSGVGGWITVFLTSLHYSLYWVIGAVISLLLLLR